MPDLKINAKNATNAVGELAKAEDNSLDRVVLHPETAGTHPYLMQLINDSYRALKDGGTLRMGFVDRRTYGAKHPTIKNHFYEADLKDMVIKKTKFESGEFSTKDQWLVMDLTKKAGQPRTIREDLLGNPIAKTTSEGPVNLAPEPVPPLTPEEAAMPLAPPEKFSDDPADADGTTTDETDPDTGADGVTPNSDTTDGHPTDPGSQTKQPHPNSKAGKAARAAAAKAAAAANQVNPVAADGSTPNEPPVSSTTSLEAPLGTTTAPTGVGNPTGTGKV
jgi:hypothetical protein